MTTPRRTQTWVLGLAATASFLVALDLLAVSTALSTIRRDIGASTEQLEWTINAYTLSFAVLLMTASALGDRFGRRRVYAAGLGLFAAASAACALSSNVGFLIVARAVQGAGAATILPLALALLNTAFPPERRGWAMGIYGGITGLAAVLGPVVGGAITQGISWQWIFWVNVPIALVAIPLLFARVPESFGPRARIDVPGVALVTVAALGLVWGLVRGNAAGWGSTEVLGALVGGVGAGVAFVVAELRSAAPMVPMRLFRSRTFSAGNAAVFFFNAALTGTIYLTAQFLQVVLGDGPLAAGLGLLPWGVAPFLLAPRTGALADRVGERPLIVAGFAGMTAGLAWIALVAGAGMSYAELIAPMALLGLGLTAALPALTKAVVGGVEVGDIGKASGVFTTLRQLGGAFGVAIVVAVFAGTGSYASPGAFADGFVPAIAVATALAAAGGVAAWLLPRRARAAEPKAAPVASAA
jgi:EmrB/QacA subfamily drug resistance transporter